MKQIALLGGDTLAPKRLKPEDGAPVYTSRSAELSPCGTYRYRLTRAWGAGPSVLFVLLHPVTRQGEDVANVCAEGSAPTPVRCPDRPAMRCVQVARAWGRGSVVVVSLFARVATDWLALDYAREDGREIVGPHNDSHLEEALAARHDRVIAAWGAQPTWGRDRDVAALARDLGVRLEALRLTETGHPVPPPVGPNFNVPQPVAFEVPQC